MEMTEKAMMTLSNGEFSMMVKDWAKLDDSYQFNKVDTNNNGKVFIYFTRITR